MERYQNNIQDQFGNAISGVTVTVRRVSDGGVATLFSDNIGTSKSNPFTNDSDGELFFYAINDRYDIFFTGAITDQKDDVLLLDITTTGSTIRIHGDIVTATPPTTEAITANLEYADLDDNDFIARVGFQGSNTFRIKNLMHGGNMEFTGEDAAGVDRFLITGDPDGNTAQYYAGDIRTQSILAGFRVLSAGSTDAEDRVLDLTHANATLRARIGFDSAAGSTLRIRNYNNSGHLELSVTDTGAVKEEVLVADPDGNTDIYDPVSSVIRIGTNTTGRATIFSDGNTDAEQRTLNLAHQDGTVRSSFGNVTSTELIIRNLIHGGPVQIQAEDAGGNARMSFDADPDAATIIRGDTDVEIRVAMTGTTTSELAIDCIANGAVVLYEDGVSEFQTKQHNAASSLSGAQVKHFDGNFYDSGLAKCPLNEISANEDLDNNNQHHFTNKNAGGALSLELQNNSNIQTGTMWLVSNEDTEDLTIDAATNTCTLRWFDGGGVAAPTGDRTLAEAGVCTIIKIGVAEYFIWGVGLS